MRGGGNEFCPFQHQLLFTDAVFLEGMEEFPAPLPVSGFAFPREATEKQVGFCSLYHLQGLFWVSSLPCPRFFL